VAKTAAEYLAQAKLGAAPTAKPAAAAPKFDPNMKLGLAGTSSDPNKQDPVTWLMDMISRPLYAVTDGIKGQLDAGAAVKKVADAGGSFGDRLAAEFNAVKAHNVLTGLTSTDHSNKNTTSNLIEQGTDLAGSYDPNYKNTQNNVNPVLKGVLGFAGDIAFDPTTYIPGAAFLKAGKMGLGAVKALGTGAKVGADAIKAAAAARKGEEVVSAVAKDIPITPDNAVASDLAKTVDPALPPVELTPAQKLTQHQQGLIDQHAAAIADPKNADIKTALAGIKPFVKEPVLKAVADPSKAMPLGFADWRASASEAASKLLQHPKLADLPISKAMGAFEKVSIGGEKIPLPVALERASKGDPVALTDLAHYHQTRYTDLFNKGKAEGKLVDPLGHPIKPVSTPVVDAAKLSELDMQATTDLRDAADFADAVAAPTAPPKSPVAISAGFQTNQQWIDSEIAAANAADGVTNHDATSVLEWMTTEADKSQTALDAAQQAANPNARTVLNAMQAFKTNAAKNESFVRASLGNDLVDNLMKYTNAGSFQSTIDQLSRIMDGSLNITMMSKIEGPSKLLLEKLGFDNPKSIPADMKRLSDAAGAPLPKLPRKNAAAPHIDTAALLASMNVDEVQQEVVDLATTALKDFTRKNIIEPKDPLKYPYTTLVEDAARTAKDMGDGVGRILNEANTMAQGDLGNSLLQNAMKAVEKVMGKQYGAAAAIAKSDFHRQALRLAERGLDALGTPLTLGVGFNNGVDRVLLGGSQVLDVLNSVDAKALNIGFYNYNTAVPLTNLYDAAFAAVHGASRADIEAALRNTMTAYGRDLPNNLVNPVLSKGKYMFGTQVFTGDQLVKMMADSVEKATPSLQKVVADNAAAHAARGLSETMKMTNDQLTYLEKTYAEATGFGDLLQAIADTGTRVVAQATDIGAMTESTLKTGAILKGSIPVVDMKQATVAVKIQEAADNLGIHLTPAQQLDEMKKVGNLQAQGLYDTVITEAAKLDTGTVDIGTITQRNFGSSMWSMWAPLNRTFGNKWFHNDFRFSEDMAKGISMTAANEIAKVDKLYTREVKIEAFRNLQRGVISSNAEHAAAAEAYRPLVDQLFGTGHEANLKDNAFFRNATAVYHLNKVLQQKGLGEHLVDVAAAVDASKVSKKSIIDEVANQWMTHDVKDPSEYLNKMFSTLVQVNAHHTLAMDVISKAKLYGAFSETPKAGWVRLTNESDKSILSAYFPKDVYFPRDVARQIGVVDSLIQETLDLGGPLGSFVNNVYRPALDMFKVGMTILQPSHHVRNVVSDMDLTRNAEGFTTKPIYKWAMEALATRNSYTNFDAIAALQGIHARPKPGRTLFKGTLAPDGITPGMLYEGVASRGVLPNYKRLENLEEVGVTSVLGKIESAANSTKLVKAAASLGEAASHYTRLAHAAQFVEKNINNTKDYKTLDELWTAASIQVKKWHPDGSDLSKFDKIMRLAIPFYSWQRKSIPLVLETFLTHPARAQVIPKASYALATSMGVNPDSLSDPFPQDQMFPSYLTDKNLGPQFKVAGKYYGINPGFATTSTLDTYLGNNPLQSVLGQLSPFIRAPFELAAGANVGTGAKINSVPDYIDSNIPIVAPVSRLTGTSVSGSIASILQGKGLQPQYQIAKGNKDAGTSSATALINILSGQSLTPMSQPNQINYAEIEKRNAAAAKGN
jgi:hypothetical protein